ncbi:MAG: RIP metalloprotease RseP [Acidobacteria bacterium]|nr:MAG: RIP metalloprotease RseP [Acidobacteriota bacterium]PYV27031.1 MAG: RIP metalloprotease RseP [Acidobacteriota bacterium]
MFSNFLTDAAVVAVVLGVMIFVHELGHFTAAKWFGVRVLTFSLGFGKRLFGFKIGDTDYRVSLLPLGGYVKMAGEEPSDSVISGSENPESSGAASATPDDDPGKFLSKPRWQRFVVIAMGPAMNIAMALAVLTCLYRYHFQKPAYEEQPARVGALEPGSPAAEAGLMPGDLILRLDRIRNPKWEDLVPKVLTSAGQTIPIDVLRDGHQIELKITPKATKQDQVGYIGVDPYQPAVIAEVEPGLPAGRAGLRPGDQIVAVNGLKAYSYPSVQQEIQAANGKEVDVTVERQGKEFHVRLTPVYTEVPGGKVWRIGVRFPNDYVAREIPWSQALASAVDFNLRNSLLTFDVLGKILTRHMSPRSLSGPIGIAQISGAAFRAGFPELLMIVSFISLQLGIFNLVPIPILDGGAILLLLIETVIRRDLSIAFKERFLQVGMAFLLILAVFLVYNDIVKTLNSY